jgi:hypothetical protein
MPSSISCKKSKLQNASKTLGNLANTAVKKITEKNKIQIYNASF